MATSHRGIAYHFEHNAQGKPQHHSFSPFISVECMHVKRIISECVVLGKISGGHCLSTVCGPVAEISASVQNSRFLLGQVK